MNLNVKMTTSISAVFLVLCVILSCTVNTSSSPVLQAVNGCVVKGHTYHIGESYSPSVCVSCQCTAHGDPLCLSSACAMPNCVDPTNDPTKCCQECPNGENCRAHDGTIIKKGETYNPTPDESCQCPTNSFMFGAPLAICVVTMPDQVQTVS